MGFPSEGGELLRIGDKLISREKVRRSVEQLLELRARGLSQQDAAESVGVDRTFVSRLETLGEVYRGEKVALIGFPVANCDELKGLAAEEGVEFVWLMTDEERRAFVQDVSGAELVNELMGLAARVRGFDAVIFLGSNMRIKMAEAMIWPGNLVGVELGRSPIQNDVHVDVEYVRRLIRQLKEGSKV